jgi:zinc protease
VNASTSFDETIYQLELPADDPADMETAFQILEDWAQGLTLDPEEIDLERGVVIEEWRIGQNASARLRDRQFPVIFADSRYAERLPIGTLESLQTFEHDALRRFYTDWYRPDLMAVIAVGDFETATVESLLRQHFEGIPMPANPRERIEYGVPDHEETLFSINTDPEIPSTSVAVYHKMDPHGDWSHAGYRDRIVGRLYNSMLNSRFQEIERQPDAPFLQASSAQGSLIRTKAAYALSAAVLENGTERGLESVFREAERVERFGFTESELEREKANILRGMERVWADRANRTSGSYAGEYTRAFLEDESIPGIEYEWELYQRFLPGITLDEVNRLAEDWLTDDNRVVLLTGPEKDGVEMPDEEVLNRVLERVDAEELTPYVDSITDEALISELP